jgi:hypothetical protein
LWARIADDQPEASQGSEQGQKEHELALALAGQQLSGLLTIDQCSR